VSNCTNLLSQDETSLISFFIYQGSYDYSCLIQKGGCFKSEVYVDKAIGRDSIYCGAINERCVNLSFALNIASDDATIYV
jgi:hypothetical protein